MTPNREDITLPEALLLADAHCCRHSSKGEHMKAWIMELCPEIAEWQAELIAEQAQEKVADQREACAALLETNAMACENPIHRSLLQANAAEIRALGQEMPLFDDWSGGIK